MKWICAFFLFAFLVSLYSAQELDDAETKKESESVKSDNEINPSNYNQEVECSRAGGICIAKSVCPAEKRSLEGDCPTQRDLGVVCCHSLSTTETNCKNLGGHCRETCSDDLVMRQATDCPENEKCCPLVV